MADQPSSSTPATTPSPTSHAPSSTSTPITLRPPSTAPFHTPSAAPTPAPSPAWLTGTWHVTHSTLPMWRSARNVRITYTPLPGSDPVQLDDLVEYNPLNSEKAKSVRGVDKPEAGGWAYKWRGRGWLVIAGSRWEVLGYGTEEGEGGDGEGANEWVVTFFAKTLFTPAGLDLYSRSEKRLGEGTVEGIKKALEGLGDVEVGRLAGEIFEVKIGEAE